MSAYYRSFEKTSFFLNENNFFPQKKPYPPFRSLDIFNNQPNLAIRILTNLDRIAANLNLMEYEFLTNSVFSFHWYLNFAHLNPT